MSQGIAVDRMEAVGIGIRVGEGWGETMRRWAGLAGWMVLLGGVGAARAQGTAVPVAQVEIKRFVGPWFEIARLPNKRERGCLADAITLYTEREKAFRFAEVSSCRLADGTVNSWNKTGKTKAKVWDGRLEVQTIWPFYGKEWVLGLGSEYEWALVGTPNHKSLWVYARARVLPDEVLGTVKALAAGQGFAVEKMVMTAQPAADSRAAVMPGEAAKPASGGGVVKPR